MDPDDFDVVQTGGGPSELIATFFTNNLVFVIFFCVIALFIATVFVLVIVSLIRGKGRSRYVVMRQDDDGTLHPLPLHDPSAAQAMHHAAHQQAVAQAAHQSLNQGTINQQMFPPGS